MKGEREEEWGKKSKKKNKFASILQSFMEEI